MGKATNRVPKQPFSKNEKMERLTWPLLPSLYTCSAAPKHLASIYRLRTTAKDGPWYFGPALQRRTGEKEENRTLPMQTGRALLPGAVLHGQFKVDLVAEAPPCSAQHPLVTSVTKTK